MITQTTVYHRPHLVTDWQKTQSADCDLITTLDSGELAISSIDLATGLGIKHKNMLETINTHLPSIEVFGRVAFETRPIQTAGGPQQVRLALLNENQATFVGSLSRNTVQVVAFKVTLVREFDKARKAVAALFNKTEPNTCLIQLINRQTETIIKLERRVDAMKRDNVKALKQIQINRQYRHDLQKVTDTRKQHNELFDLFGRYMKLHSFQPGNKVLDDVIDKLQDYYNVDIKGAYRKPGEHHFDVAIRLGMGHCVAEIIKCHMYKSGDLK